jgi:hypothetical protein
MDFSEQIHTGAGADRAWAALTTVTTWPLWTASMRSVTPLDGLEIAVGHRFRISQPGFPTIVWQVSEVVAGESFTWTNSSPGVRSVAFHRLTALPDGTEITIGVHQTGPLAGLLSVFTAARTRRYLKLEAAGLKAASEESATSGNAAGTPAAGTPATRESRDGA